MGNAGWLTEPARVHTFDQRPDREPRRQNYFPQASFTRSLSAGM